MESKVTIDDVITKASEYLKKEDNLNIIREAYEVAEKQHDGQFRKSGDPYIQHPLEVAYMLAEIHGGPSTIAAGLLHDVLEDTDITKEQLEAIAEGWYNINDINLENVKGLSRWKK